MNNEGRSDKVDAVTENALLRLEGKILTKIGNSIDKAIKDFTKNFTRVYDLKIEMLEGDVAELKTTIKDLKKDIKKATRFYITIILTICGLIGTIIFGILQ